MNINTILLISVLVIFLVFLVVLVQLLKRMIRTQIDGQLEAMIPVKAIRERISIRIKWKR